MPKPSQRNQMDDVWESLENIKCQLEKLSKLDSIESTLAEIKSQMGTLKKEVKALQEENVKKDRMIYILTNKMEDMEQQNKNNEVIVTGLNIKPRSYARAASSQPDDEDNKSVEAQVAAFFHSRDIKVNLDMVDSCFLLPQKRDGTRKSESRAVIMRFVSRKQKMELLRQGKQLKGSAVFINENLTKCNAGIAWKARQLKKAGKIHKTWSTNGKIYIKLSEDTNPLLIREVGELDKYND